MEVEEILSPDSSRKRGQNFKSQLRIYRSDEVKAFTNRLCWYWLALYIIISREREQNPAPEVKVLSP